MSGRRLLLAIVAVPVLAMVPLAGSASAETLTVRDAARDVVSTPIASEGAYRPAPERREGDALKMRVAHNKSNIRVVLRLDQLTRAKKTQAFHVVSFRTNERRHGDLVLYVAGKQWQGTRTWDGPGGVEKCRGLRTHIDYANDTVTAVVPRKCLSNPRWVKVGAGTGTIAKRRVFVDDFNRSGIMEDDDLSFSARVRRG